MIYLLDTCVLSELLKKQPQPRVVEWVHRQEEERLCLSALTLGELQKGITKLPGSKRRRSLQAWLDEDLRQRFAGRILDLTPEVALLWGRLQGRAERRGRKMPLLDGLIAATALSAGAAVVTRNKEDMEPSGVETLNPWSASG